ncbi:hypothetical protein [Pseudobacteriovorax antillogorgiicola]|nr:hypothetical protein [Pseudobacteriovorax antillogorgiicola]
MLSGKLSFRRPVSVLGYVEHKFAADKQAIQVAASAQFKAVKGRPER